MDVARLGRDDAEVTVSYALGKARKTETVKVTREGLFGRWRIDAAPAVLQVETPWPVRVRVAEVATGSGAVLVAPGAYRVAVDHGLFTPATTTALVGINGGTIELKPQLRESAASTATVAIKDVVDECAASTEPLTVQAGCPFFEIKPRILEPASVSWSITDYPAISLTHDDGEVRVDTTDHGVAVLKLGYDERKSRTHTCRFNVDGPLEILGADVTWSSTPVKNLEGCKGAGS